MFPSVSVRIVRMRDELADFLESQQQRALMNDGGNTHVRRMVHVVPSMFSANPHRSMKIDDAHRAISRLFD